MLRSKSFKEGLVGLFILLGVFVFGGAIFWLKGGNFKDDSYQIVAKFEDAAGLKQGAKVRYRGIEVGKILEILPGANGVDIVMEINSDLKIPQQVKVESVHYGLLGEAVIDMFPLVKLTTEAESINPLSSQCNQSDLILCDQQRIEGQAGPQLATTLSRMSELYTNQQFYDNLNAAAVSTALAGRKIATLSDDLSDFSKDIRKDIDKISQTAEALTNTANVASEQITVTSEQIALTSEALRDTANVTSDQIAKLSDGFNDTSYNISNASREIANTFTQVNALVANLNGIIDYNKSNFNSAIASVGTTTVRLNKLLEELEYTVTEANSTIKDVDTKKIAKNLEEFSTNLQEISTSLNQPTNLVTLQQTLDSARVTFENTAKITSDLDELTGDPEFRSNVKKLVDGLGELVSYNESLEKQIELAKVLESANKMAIGQNNNKNTKITHLNKKNKNPQLKLPTSGGSY